MREVPASAEPRLILICLGNPGAEYAATRHNAGWLFGDCLRQRHEFAPFEPLEGVEATAARGELAGLPALIAKPGVAMNDAGRVAATLVERFGAEGRLYALAHDDLDVPLGSAKGRARGGHGGHNGVRSVLGEAPDVPFFRLKLGVGSARKGGCDSVAEFLLSPFEEGERAELEESFPQAEQVLVGEARSLAARLAKQDRRDAARRRYAGELLEEAREALEGLDAASPYPVFLNPSEASRLLDVVTALTKLLRKARATAGRDDAFYDRLASFIPEGLRPLLPARTGSQRLFYAADLHLSQAGLKVIELNCAVGYAHYARLADEALLPLLSERLDGLERPTDAEFAAFLYQHGLKPLLEPDAGALAFLRGFGGRDMFNVDELERLAARVGRLAGAEVPLCHEGDLEPAEGGLRLPDGRRVDLLYVEENLSTWAGVAEGSPLHAAVREGRVKTFPPLDMFLLTGKGFLALLAEPEVQELLEPDEAEARVLRENLLWSSPLDARIEPAAYYMLERGLSVVVKDALGGGGRGVTVLRPDSSSQQAGHMLRRRALAGGSVVQGYFPAGRWSQEVDLRFDLRVLAAAHAGDVNLGPVCARVFRGEKVSFAEPDAGVAPVYVLR